jgi:hypothetical protein
VKAEGAWTTIEYIVAKIGVCSRCSVCMFCGSFLLQTEKQHPRTDRPTRELSAQIFPTNTTLFSSHFYTTHHYTKQNMMNPRAPDYRAQPPATNVSKGSDLASLFSNLHTSSSPAAAATATPSVSTISPQKMQTHDQTLIRFVPASSGVNARAASSPGKSTVSTYRR